MKSIGVLALQGDFARHIETLRTLGVRALEVREARQLDGLDGLIIPGGESTVMGKLLLRFDMAGALRQFGAAGKPVYGTCAGAILLSTHIERYDQVRLGLLDIQIRRNGYGRQLESFEVDLPVPALGEPPLRAIFIRAPVITGAGSGVEVLASYGGDPVFVRQKNIISTTFHPELTGDTRVHRYFLSMI